MKKFLVLLLCAVSAALAAKDNRVIIGTYTDAGALMTSYQVKELINTYNSVQQAIGGKTIDDMMKESAGGKAVSLAGSGKIWSFAFLSKNEAGELQLVWALRSVGENNRLQSGSDIAAELKNKLALYGDNELTVSEIENGCTVTDQENSLNITVVKQGKDTVDMLVATGETDIRLPYDSRVIPPEFVRDDAGLFYFRMDCGDLAEFTEADEGLPPEEIENMPQTVTATVHEDDRMLIADISFAFKSAEAAEKFGEQIDEFKQPEKDEKGQTAENPDQPLIDNIVYTVDGRSCNVTYKVTPEVLHFVKGYIPLLCQLDNTIENEMEKAE